MLAFNYKRVSREGLFSDVGLCLLFLYLP